MACDASGNVIIGGSYADSIDVSGVPFNPTTHIEYSAAGPTVCAAFYSATAPAGREGCCRAGGTIAICLNDNVLHTVLPRSAG